MSDRYRVTQLDDLDPVACPCGHTRRAFTDDPDRVASAHLLEVSRLARRHYHRTLTELYIVLEGEGHVELDDDVVPVRPLTAILIKPGCRHRAVGDLRVLNVPIPAFDPADEWFD